jgi:hypothetical protein
VKRERLIRAALSAYPPDALERRGEEMRGTVLDASDGSATTFVRELLALVSGGLRARSALDARTAPRRLFADACCLAATVWIAIQLLRLLTFELEPYPPTVPWQLSLLVFALALALVGYDRAAGLCGLGWVALANPWMPIGGRWVSGGFVPTWVSGVVTNDVVFIALLAVMIVAPRRRASDVRRLGWLLLPCAVAAIDAFDTSQPVVPVLALSALALAAMSINARLAIAVTLWWTAFPATDLFGGLVGHGGDVSLALDLGLLAISLLLVALPLQILRMRRRELASGS